MITILGATGFFGSHLVKRLAQEGTEYYAPSRDAVLTDRPLGTVIYTIGLTADFRTRPFDTVEAHVCKLLGLLRDGDFDKLVYVSSTRVYNRQMPIALEDEPLLVNPLVPTDNFNISKLMGESIALRSGRKVSCVRVSNVYGPDFNSDNFLTSVLRDAVTQGKVTLQTKLASAKDYVSIDDVVDGLLTIARKGEQPIYNLGGGRQTTHQELGDEIAHLTGATFDVVENAYDMSFPPISIARMQQEFSYSPAYVLDDLEKLVQMFREHDFQQFAS